MSYTETGWGQPQTQQPQGPKKSWVARHKVLTILGAIVLFIIVVAAIAGGASDSKKTADSKPAAAPAHKAAPQAHHAKAAAKPAVKKAPAAKPASSSEADQFKAFIAKEGTPGEKAAAQHIIKVQGAGSENNILDSADVYTDYTGGLMGPHQGDAKLLASAFADWKHSKNGLVTIYDAKGEILSNGNF